MKTQKHTIYSGKYEPIIRFIKQVEGDPERYINSGKYNVIGYDIIKKYLMEYSGKKQTVTSDEYGTAEYIIEYTDSGQETKLIIEMTLDEGPRKKTLNYFVDHAMWILQEGMNQVRQTLFNSKSLHKNMSVVPVRVEVYIFVFEHKNARNATDTALRSVQNRTRDVYPGLFAIIENEAMFPFLFEIGIAQTITLYRNKSWYKGHVLMHKIASLFQRIRIPGLTRLKTS